MLYAIGIGEIYKTVFKINPFLVGLLKHIRSIRRSQI